MVSVVRYRPRNSIDVRKRPGSFGLPVSGRSWFMRCARGRSYVAYFPTIPT